MGLRREVVGYSCFFPSFLIKYFVLNIILYLFLLSLMRMLDISNFKAIPYIRFFLVLFSSFWFSVLFVRRKTLNFSKKLPYIWFIFSTVDLIVGILYRNPVVYIVSDYIYILWGVYLYNSSAMILFYKGKRWLSCGSYLNVLIILIIFSSLLVREMVPPLLFMSVTWFFLSLYYYNMNLRLIFLLCIIMFMIPNRAFLFSFAWLSLLFALYKTNEGRTDQNLRFLLKIFIAIFIPSFFVGVVYILYKFLPSNHPIHYRIVQILDLLKGEYNTALVIPLLERMMEAKAVVNQLTMNFAHIILGSGLGATIPASYVVDISVLKASFIGDRTVHNIHILPFALLHKYGILGLIIMLTLIIEFYRSSKFLVSPELVKSSAPMVVWSNIFYVFLFLFSLPAASFLWTSPCFWITLFYKDFWRKECLK